MKKLALTLTALFALGMFMPASAGPGFKIKDVDEFAFFQPCACIDMYYTNGGYYSQPQTDKAAGMVADIINMENFPFSDMIPADYYGDGANADALKWARILAETKPKDVSRLRIPKSLLKQLKESEDRYGVLIYTYGYVTSVEAYEKEVRDKAISRAVDAVAEELTGVKGLTNPSMNYNAEIPYNNEMLCVVIDKEERSVVYFKKQDAPMFNSHPTDYEDVSKMLHKLLKEFIK
ncbi:MAG: hypothetical protein II676_01275 [Bacteroidales bacterium]|nr:hypothetical protein [Bacteroidales bacterium]